MRYLSVINKIDLFNVENVGSCFQSIEHLECRRRHHLPSNMQNFPGGWHPPDPPSGRRATRTAARYRAQKFGPSARIKKVKKYIKNFLTVNKKT